MEEPLVSVIVPVYNAGAWLHPCLESIRGQSYPHLEVLLVNDGSTDGSLAVCEEFEAAVRAIYDAFVREPASAEG